ncbi:MAG: peptidase M15 [Candidatus Aenigmatarchaeota archaeon]|nr:MAG: peptidase M15 [Candidatus Aenigmarchaeota archaeon]
MSNLNQKPILKHFKLSEFNCPCCGLNHMNPVLLLLLDRAREISGIPFVITSGFRCASHNSKIGGVSDSAHLTGYAVDISVIDSEDRLAVLFSLFQCGFKRIGISKFFIHADIDPTKPKCIWLY